jgi:citrate lyase subunit beta/citryl-CoA lyase
VIAGRPDGIMLPKARDGADVERASHWLESLEARGGLGQGSIGLIPLITESAGAVLNAASFTRLPARVRGLTWGAEDLAADIGALGNRLPDGEFEFAYAYARSMCLLAAAAAGVAAIDTVDTEIRDGAAVERRARDSRRQGFAGKMAIHPAQVAPIHAAFSPSAAEVEWAGRVLAAFSASPGAGAVTLDGRMLDRPHIRQAERIVAAAARR